MTPTSIEYVLMDEREPAVRIKTQDGQDLVFYVMSQKFLANGWKVALVDNVTNDDFPVSVYTIPGGDKYEARWVRDPLIVRIVEDACQATLANTWKEGPIPISRYIKGQK